MIRIKIKREFCNADKKFRLFLFHKGRYVGKLMEECERWIRDNDKPDVHWNGTHWGIYDDENNFYPIYNCSLEKPK